MTKLSFYKGSGNLFTMLNCRIFPVLACLSQVSHYFLFVDIIRFCFFANLYFFYLAELASETFSQVQKGRSLKRLYVEDAAEFTRNACVSPCSLVLALLYLERLKADNPEYVKRIAPSELFFVSLVSVIYVIVPRCFVIFNNFVYF